MSQPIVPDPWVSPLVTGLLECLCQTLNAEPYTPVCRCCARHSQSFPPMDACDCSCTVGNPPADGNGEAWVRVVRTYSATNQSRIPGCPTLLVIELQLGIYRCISGVPDQDGTPPGCEAITNDALLMLNDAAAMRRAAMCCSAIADLDPVIGAYQPIGPSGGCAGGALTVTVARTP